MERFVKADIVVIPYPFSDLSGSKKRPALVMADLQGDDIILCQITSQQVKDNYAIPVKNSDFKTGRLTAPLMFQLRYKTLHMAPLEKFPFMILYQVGQAKNLVAVAAVLHTSRNPKIWKERSNK